jgi:hypothetical protein
MEDTYKLFGNVCSFYNNKLEDDLIDDENIKGKNTTFKNKPKLDDVNLLNEGIIYETVNLYLLMAFQEFVKKTDQRIEKLENNDNSLIKKNNLYINDRLDEIIVRLDNIEFNGLRIEDVYRIKNIINTQDEIYRTINNDIKKVQLSNDILRDKYIDNVESNIIIQNSLKDKIVGLENEINELKEENIKFKLALKMIMGKIDKKP